MGIEFKGNFFFVYLMSICCVSGWYCRYLFYYNVWNDKMCLMFFFISIFKSIIFVKYKYWRKMFKNGMFF